MNPVLERDLQQRLKTKQHVSETVRANLPKADKTYLQIIQRSHQILLDDYTKRLEKVSHDIQSLRFQIRNTTNLHGPRLLQIRQRIEEAHQFKVYLKQALALKQEDAKLISDEIERRSRA